MSARFGRYELLRPLGRGGMAEVFLARYIGPEGFEKRLVIKRVLPRFADDQRLLRMFFEEARTHVSLSHGNLVSVFDFGRVGDEYFIAMEHVHGADLAALLDAARTAGAPLPPSLCAQIGVELCRGLAYVHRKGLVHRDISPRNVLCSVDGEVKLSDFGLVLSAAGADAPGIKGTLAYTSPEQARGERVDGRADLYALGLVLAEATTGRRVRRGGVSESAALALAQAGTPVALDGPLGGVLARATATRPEERFADAAEMLTALEAEAARLGVGREASLRELAQRVAAATPPDVEPPPAAPPPPAAVTVVSNAALAPTAIGHRPASPAALDETYYRGNESEHFVDDVIRPRTAPALPRRGSRLLLGGLGLLLAGLAGVLTLRGLGPAARDHSPGGSRATPTASPAAASPAAAGAPSPLASVAAAPPAPFAAGAAAPHAPLASGAARPPRRAVVAAPRSTATGTLTLRCTPWCIPFVDGKSRGSDRMNHSIVLPAGRHIVEVRRLDDHLERTVDIQPGQTLAAEFQFR